LNRFRSAIMQGMLLLSRRNLRLRMKHTKPPFAIPEFDGRFP